MKDPFDLKPLQQSFGGSWCDCIKKVFDGITPRKVAAYCIAMEYRPFHEPVADDIGVRYGYFLKTVKELTTVGKDEVEREKNIVASFGEFYHRSYETRHSALQAIVKIADFEGRTPHQVALDVVEADESTVPEAKAQKEEPRRAPAPGTRRYEQTANGLRAI